MYHFLQESPLLKRYGDAIIIISTTAGLTGLYFLSLQLSSERGWVLLAVPIDVNPIIIPQLLKTINIILLVLNVIGLLTTSLAMVFVARNTDLVLPIRILAILEQANKFIVCLVYIFFSFCPVFVNQSPQFGNRCNEILTSVMTAISYIRSDYAYQSCAFFLSARLFSAYKSCRYLALSFNGVYYRYILKWPVIYVFLPNLVAVGLIKLNGLFQQLFNFSQFNNYFIILVFSTCALNFFDESKIKKGSDYAEARDECRLLGGSLAMPRDTYENAAIGEAAGTFALIGVHRRPNGKWFYDDGTPSSYQNWAQEIPANRSSCVVINANGLWFPVDCASKQNFICTTFEILRCSADWIFFEDNCYYFFNQNLQIKNAKFTRASAESACNRMGAHLVSIHSARENDFVLGKIFTNFFHDGTSCVNAGVLIGLSCSPRTAYSNSWMWSDETSVDYFPRENVLCRPEYSMINDINCFSEHVWNDWPEWLRGVSRYICKKAPNKY